MLITPLQADWVSSLSSLQAVGPLGRRQESDEDKNTPDDPVNPV